MNTKQKHADYLARQQLPPHPDCPICTSADPTIEQMIEEMHGVAVFRRYTDCWFAGSDPLTDGACAIYGPECDAPLAAIRALYEKWKE